MRSLHDWSLAPEKATRIQNKLRDQLTLSWTEHEIRLVAGVDVGIRQDLACCAIVVLGFPGLAILETAAAEVPLSFPYIPGFLSFREGPAVLAAWKNLHIKPDLLIFDGQGIAHPRGIGIAAHLGLWLDRRSIGAAKSHLYGRYEDPPAQKGSWSALRDEAQPERVVGAVLRTKENVKPIFVSPGHRMDVPHALHFVLNCCTNYRLPEPTRLAHLAAKDMLSRDRVY